MRLNSIDCIKGELFKKDHILLQFTGMYDKQKDEIYEMDIVLIGSEKFLVMWDTARNGWVLVTMASLSDPQPFVEGVAGKSVRLCSYFESEKGK